MMAGASWPPPERTVEPIPTSTGALAGRASAILPTSCLTLVEAGAPEHDRHRAPQNTHVQSERAVLDVVEVELDSLAPGQRGAAIDLGPAGDAGPDREPATLALCVLGHLHRDRWARADERQLAAHHAQQVGQLVQRRPAQEGAHSRDSGVVLVDRQTRAHVLGAVYHRAQLQQVELLAVLADAALTVDRVPARLQPDREHRQPDRGRCHDQCEHAEDDVDRAADHAKSAPCSFQRFIARYTSEFGREAHRATCPRLCLNRWALGISLARPLSRFPRWGGAVAQPVPQAGGGGKRREEVVARDQKGPHTYQTADPSGGSENDLEDEGDFIDAPGPVRHERNVGEEGEGMQERR